MMNALLGPTTGNVVLMIMGAMGIFIIVLSLLILGEWIVRKPWKRRHPMHSVVNEFSMALEKNATELARIDEQKASMKPDPQRWSKKEILGHLIDSASNNHQRFVRAQLSGELKLPGYEQREWVDVQQYQHEDWSNLILLWKSYNQHLVHAILSIDPVRLNTLVFVGDQPPVPLSDLIRDYIAHANHHLSQLLPQ